MSQRNKDRINWIGVCLLIIGVASLSKGFHWDFYHNFHFFPLFNMSWEIILIAVGFLLMLLGRGAGVTLMLIGGFFLFTDEVFMAIGNIHQWWPAALIIVGVVLLTRSKTVQKS